jgi:hypothetical protein
MALPSASTTATTITTSNADETPTAASNCQCECEAFDPVLVGGVVGGALGCLLIIASTVVVVFALRKRNGASESNDSGTPLENRNSDSFASTQSGEYMQIPMSSSVAPVYTAPPLTMHN